MKTFTLLLFIATIIISCKKNEIPEPTIELKEVGFQVYSDHCNLVYIFENGLPDTALAISIDIDRIYMDTVGDRLYAHTWNDTTTIVNFYVDGELYATDTADINGETLIDTILH